MVVPTATIDLPTWNFETFACQFEQWSESYESGKSVVLVFLEELI
jgi:hypothetical protein